MSKALVQRQVSAASNDGLHCQSSCSLEPMRVPRPSMLAYNTKKLLPKC